MMNFASTDANIFIPDGAPLEEALARTTHLGIGAHQDDLEILAYPGILECFESADKWFTGVVVTNGSGSPRTGPFAAFSDEQMMERRKLEQIEAAKIGRYSMVIQLGCPSSAVKNTSGGRLVQDLAAIIKQTGAKVIYTHNLADKHDTHVAVTLRVVEAMRSLNNAHLPEFVFGMEVWRDLDWLPDHLKTVFDVSGNDKLAADLLAVFESQISGGKRYDLAVAGRRRANATFSESHSADICEQAVFGMDMTAFISDHSITPSDFIKSILSVFESDVLNRIARLG